MLLVVSTLVAFDGWSGGGVSDDVEQLFVAQDRPDLPLSGPELVAADAASASRAVAARPVARRGTRTAPRGGRDVAGNAPTQREGGSPGSGAPGTAVPALVPASPPDVDPDRVRSDLSQTAKDTTKKAGDAVTPVSPPAGQAVSDTGAALAEIVDSLPKAGSLKTTLP
jgi:hypothetical protein